MEKCLKMDNTSLIDGCIKENRISHELLYKKYSPQMMGVCRRYFNDINDCSDVLTVSFVKIFDKLYTLKDPLMFEGWMRRIVINECLTLIKKKNRLKFVEINNVDVPFDDYSLNRLELKDLMDCLDLLPIGYKTIFNLCAVDGYTHEEIGEMLGVKNVTSRSQYLRARLKLNQIITNKYSAKVGLF